MKGSSSTIGICLTEILVKCTGITALIQSPRHLLTLALAFLPAPHLYFNINYGNSHQRCQRWARINVKTCLLPVSEPKHQSLTSSPLGRTGHFQKDSYSESRSHAMFTRYPIGVPSTGSLDCANERPVVLTVRRRGLVHVGSCHCHSRALCLKVTWDRHSHS